MKIGLVYDGLKYLVAGLLCLLIAGFLLASLHEVSAERRAGEALEALPNHNYVPDIRALKDEGRLSEALEMARFVLRHADMPGQEEAKALEKALDEETTSLWGRAKRVTNGFVKGSGNSIEELSGGIASDMIVWGDVRDLLKQGYYKITGKETDPVVASLAGLGLLTEAVDAADWAPSVLKAFRKIGALSGKFADFVMTAARKSVKARQLDGALKTALANVRSLADTMGLARTAAVFKHVDDPADLAALAAVARKNTDAVYFTVRNGGADGVGILRRLGDTDAAVAGMAQAAKKGPAGIRWLQRGGPGHRYVLMTRVGTRLLKNLRLHRPQRLVVELAREHPGLEKALWAGMALALLGACVSMAESGRRFLGLRQVGSIPGA